MERCCKNDRDPPPCLTMRFSNCIFCGYGTKDWSIRTDKTLKNSWWRYVGEYFNTSQYWRKCVKEESEFDIMHPRYISIRGRCSKINICVFCGECIGCGEEIPWTRNTWWRYWGIFFNYSHYLIKKIGI